MVDCVLSLLLKSRAQGLWIDRVTSS